MAIWTDEELDRLLLAGLLEEPPVDDAEPEIPDWLLEAPQVEEPLCDCGCGRPRAEVEDAAAVPAPRTPAEPVRWAVPGVWDQDTEPQRVAPSVGDVVAQAQELIGRIATVDPSGLPAGQALGEAEALARVQHELRLLQLARTEDVRVRKLHEHLGYRSVTAWQRQSAPDSPKGDRSLARALPTSPWLAEALSDRRVCFAAAGKVKTSLGKVRLVLDRPDGFIDSQPGEPVVGAVAWNVVDLVCKDRFGLSCGPAADPEQAALLAELEAGAERIVGSGGSQRDRVEQAMVLLATHLSPDVLQSGLDELVDQLRPTVLEQQDKDAQDKRALSLTTNPDGTWDLHATLTPEAGEQVFTALAAEARRDPANPLDTHAREQARAAAADASGADAWIASQDREAWQDRALRDYRDESATDGELVPRSRSKRLHDAFGRLLSRYLAHGLGGVSGKVPVQVTVTTSHRTVEGAPGAPPARGASGRPLARSLLRRWWCDAHVTTLLMSRGWQPLGVVHSARTITGTELKAVRVRFDNRCPGLDCCPGTPDPLIPLVPHHVRLHSVFGVTSIEETLLVCDRLHADLHVGKRTVRLRDGRLITEGGFLESDP